MNKLTEKKLNSDIEYLRDKLFGALEPACNPDKGFWQDDTDILDGSEGECQPPYTDEELAAPFDYPEEYYTCFNCPDKDTCEYAFDEYCTDGDCLILK